MKASLILLGLLISCMVIPLIEALTWISKHFKNLDSFSKEKIKGLKMLLGSATCFGMIWLFYELKIPVNIISCCVFLAGLILFFEGLVRITSSKNYHEAIKRIVLSREKK